ncbi:hypothetical protein [Sphingobium ummariense]|uniref:Uncharacterized protein n=1 Tax=Sphingobium ummariense RL-3 TaxID=1346791 RepID=T0KEX4_9SPHN|nr:hypothetical protein [Sphingobium ummariense]EQB31973.1 hypothetical protein M529_11975 [Sphingobium ummariense RL-3]
MTDWETMVAIARAQALQQAKMFDLRYFEAEDERSLLIQLVGKKDAGGEPYHPMRIETQIWKPLNADHGVADVSTDRGRWMA